MKQRQIKGKKPVGLKDLMKCWQLFIISVSYIPETALEGEKITSISNDKLVDITVLVDTTKITLNENQTQTIATWMQQSKNVTIGMIDKNYSPYSKRNEFIYHKRSCIYNSYGEICYWIEEK